MAGEHGQKVSLRRIIGNVVDLLDLEDVSSRISAFARWAVAAELKIGSKNSYEAIECELEVENYRACLPPGFVWLIGLKKGRDHLEMSDKDFVQWFKGSKEVKIKDDPRFQDGNNKAVINTQGVPNLHEVSFLGLFNVGEIINVAVTNDDCGDLSTNTFSYTVQPADTIMDIVNALVNQINAITNLPYTAIPTQDAFQIQAKTPLVNLQVAVWTNSNTGTVTHTLLQARVLPEENPQNPNDDCVADIKQTSENLAEKSAYHLNDNIYSEQPYYAGNGYYGTEGEFNYQASKYAIRNNHIHFNSIQNGKVGISYYGLYLDEEGWPLIDSSHEDAVTAYLMWKGEYRNYKRGKVGVSYMKDLEQQWYWECGQARGDDEMPNEDEQQYLANMWNQLIPLPNNNFF